MIIIMYIYHALINVLNTHFVDCFFPLLIVFFAGGGVDWADCSSVY